MMDSNLSGHGYPQGNRDIDAQPHRRGQKCWQHPFAVPGIQEILGQILPGPQAYRVAQGDGSGDG